MQYGALNPKEEALGKYYARIDEDSDADEAAEAVENCGAQKVRLRRHEGRIYFETDEATMDAVSLLGCIAGVSEIEEDDGGAAQESRGRYIGLDRGRN